MNPVKERFEEYCSRNTIRPPYQMFTTAYIYKFLDTFANYELVNLEEKSKAIFLVSDQINQLEKRIAVLEQERTTIDLDSQLLQHVAPKVNRLWMDREQDLERRS